VAHAAGMSPETLRKIETDRLPTPAFGTIACLSEVLDLPVQDGRRMAGRPAARGGVVTAASA
jgi:hypothetical protein